MFGRSSHIWVEGEGMLHVLYFDKARDGSWTVTYKNKYVEPETFKLEKQRNKPSFLPAIEGSSPAILSAYLLNLVGRHINAIYIYDQLPWRAPMKI
jgi:carotenoid cleavage dioxygenase